MDFTYFLANPSKLKGGTSIIPHVNYSSKEETKTKTTSTPEKPHESVCDTPQTTIITKCDVSGAPHPNATPKPKEAKKKSMMPWTDLIVNQKKKMN